MLGLANFARTAEIPPNRYFGDWSSYEDVVASLSDDYQYDANGEYRPTPPTDFPKDAEILFAEYGTGYYDGDAVILYLKDGELREWSDSHCSCNGLSWRGGGGQVTWEALALRPRDENATYSGSDEGREAFWLLVDGHTAAKGGVQ